MSEITTPSCRIRMRPRSPKLTAAERLCANVREVPKTEKANRYQLGGQWRIQVSRNTNEVPIERDRAVHI